VESEAALSSIDVKLLYAFRGSKQSGPGMHIYQGQSFGDAYTLQRMISIVGSYFIDFVYGLMRFLRKVAEAWDSKRRARDLSEHARIRECTDFGFLENVRRVVNPPDQQAMKPLNDGIYYLSNRFANLW
jgi:hypothetical protein